MARFWQTVDLTIWGSLIILVSLGFLLIFPYSAELARQQVLFILFGLIFILVLSKTDYRLFNALGLYIFLSSVFILMMLRFFGEEIRGSIRWFTIGKYQLQPSEILKPFLIISMASFIDQADLSKPQTIIKIILALLPALLLIFIQPDLGNTVIYLGVLLVMMIVGGLPKAHLLLGSLVMAILFPSLWMLLRDYQRQRVLSFINPAGDPLGSGYHTIQSLIAVGSGGLLGKGIGKGTQSRLEFLPEQHNDFIFATLAEETGLVGASLTLTVFVFLIWRVIKLSEISPDRFSCLLITGLGAQLLIQMFINAGMNMGLLPVTGVTFPFLSYGGSSLVGSMISIGLIQSVGARTKANLPIDINKID